MSRFELREADFELNATLDPFDLLKRMGFTDHSIYQEGDIVRVHCPIHKDLVRKSLIIDTIEKTFKCQHTNCAAHDGGLLVELAALYFECSLEDVPKVLRGEEDKASELLFRGEMYINTGRHKEALTYLQQACEMNPRDEVTRCKLAALHLELNNKDESYAEYLRAAESYAVRGELDKTLSIYNILIMLQPGAVKARRELAYLFSRMGRPDAAAEQLKWVVDYYIKNDQQRGARDTCDQILELDPENAMAHYLRGRTLSLTGDRKEAARSFETSAQIFLRTEDFGRAQESAAEGLAISPASRALHALHDQAAEAHEQAREGSGSTPTPEGEGQASEENEREFMAWLNNVDQKLGRSEPSGPPAAASREAEPLASADEIPLFREMNQEEEEAKAEESVGPNDSFEITPDDRRVELCLADMRDLDSTHLEAMRFQLVSMFTDVRKSHEEGTISDWEMKAIKEFYKAFCVAVDLHRSRQSSSA